MDFTQLPRSARYATLASLFRPAGATGAYVDSTHDPGLARASWRLLEGPGRPLVQPYESAHLEGMLMGNAAARVMQRYAEAGLDWQSGAGQLPDHISMELAFMAYLAQQEEAQTSRAVLWRARQRRFLEEHLLRWVGLFCEQVRASRVHPIFSQAAAELMQLIEEEARHLEHPEKLKRYPNIRIEMQQNRCTLCTLCVDSCRQGALSIHASLESLGLLFEPARCNGCRACQRLCPEGAIQIVKIPPTTEPAAAESQVLSEASRVICPTCSLPHIAQPWLERLAEQLGGGQAMRTSLELCPLCKANAQQISFAMETISYG